MNKKHSQKVKAREVRQARQARRVVNGVFMGLIALMVLLLLGYYYLAG